MTHLFIVLILLQAPAAATAQTPVDESNIAGLLHALWFQYANSQSQTEGSRQYLFTSVYETLGHTSFTLYVSRPRLLSGHSDISNRVIASCGAIGWAGT